MSRKQRLWAYFAAGAAICIAILAYGHLRATSRAYVSLIVGRAGQTAFDAPGFRAELILRDAAGNLLAKGETEERFGFARFVHPTLGSCEDDEKAAAASLEARSRWQTCNAHKLLWQAGWAERVKTAEVRFNDCHVSVPLTFRRRRDEWWLWWVPLPHVGGDPLTEFSAKLRVSETPCRGQAADIHE